MHLLLLKAANVWYCCPIEVDCLFAADDNHCPGDFHEPIDNTQTHGRGFHTGAECFTSFTSTVALLPNEHSLTA